MGIPVKLEAFEGPLDLLLHLIEKNKIDIYDIPIVEITEQYMEYIRQMQEENLNIMSEFMVMAATLLDIKCKMLLPKEVTEEGEEKDPREELVQQLLEYKMFKYMSYELRDRMADASRCVYRAESMPKEVLDYQPPVDIRELIGDLTLAKLQNIFNSIIKRQENKVDPIRSKFGKIEKEEVSLEDKMSDLELYAGTHHYFSFRGLLERQSGKIQVIVTFLAILELMKTGVITIEQEHLFDDIQITSLIYEEQQADGEAIGQDKTTTEKIIRNMMLKYNARDRGIKILELDGAFQLCTKQEYYEYLVEIALQPKKAVLTDVMLETLSIIAYKQPVTKQEIEKIRGVKCDHAINKLVEYNLVQELGRLDAPGRPILFGTTEEFLRNFGVQSTEDLPTISPVKMEDFKAEAEEEIQLQLDL